jgi:ClpX C4-type zinc finger
VATTTPADETDDETVIACCSFCFKPNTKVERLVAGPAVFVCNECVELCREVIAATTERPAAGALMMPWEHAQTVDAALSNLPNVSRAQAQVEEALLGWVLRARELGATWAQVGDALCITRQSAWERFAAEE